MNIGRIKFILMSILLVILVAAGGVAVSQDAETPMPTGYRADAPQYGVRGPYPVGYMRFDDGDALRPMRGDIWYPAANPDDVDEMIVYDMMPEAQAIPPAIGRALLQAEPDAADGPYPLVVFSHGSPAALSYTAFVLEHIASHGFVVIAVEHSGSLFMDSILLTPEEFRQGLFETLVLRPTDISRTIDYADVLTGAAGDLSGMIDMDKIAVVGISFGGPTALTMAGARLDFSGFDAWCDAKMSVAGEVDLFCGWTPDERVAQVDNLIEVGGLNVATDEPFPSMADERIDAIIVITPGIYIPLMSAESFTDITVPILLTKSGADGIVNNVDNADRVWENVTAPTTLYTLEHASHYVTGRCTPDWEDIPGFFDYCFEPIWDKDRAQDIINHFNVAFLMAELYDDPDAAAALLPENVSFAGVTYEIKNQ